MDTQSVINELNVFKEERKWNEFHSLINLSRALNIEASEVEKIFQWKTTDSELSDKDRKDLGFEIADVLTYAYYMCSKLEINPDDIVLEKLNQNKKRHWNFEE